MATVVLDARALGFPVTHLPLRAAVGVCRAIEEHGIRPSIKWPNDLLVNDGKVAGILCETCGSVALIGFGVNCTQRSFPPDLAPGASSILLASGVQVSPLSLLPRVLARMKEALGDDRWREKLIERLASPEDLARVEEPRDPGITTG